MRDLLAHRAAATPGATALVDARADGDAPTWTYRELDGDAETTAGRLAALGVAAGDSVGVLLEARPAVARLLFGAARLGAVLVPLNARLTPPELADQVERAGLTALVCGASTAAAAREAAGDVPVASVDDVDGVPALSERDPAPFPAAEWALDDRRLVAFTSGTTGTPKAVPLTARNLLASAVASAFRLGVVPGDRWCSPLPTYHVGGLAPLLRSTAYGTTTVLAPTDPGPLRATLHGQRCTGVSLVPTLCRRLLDDGPLPDALRFVLLGGAPAPPDLLARCFDRDVPVCPTYGLTETASQVATARPETAREHSGTVGRPLLWTDVTVVDEDGDPVPAGERGELVVAGPTVTPGYLEEGTAAFGPHGLHTGDVGRRDEAGRLWVLNRRSDRILTGGENVDPGEVVAALREHPDVRDAAVVGLADPEWGERVAALLVPESDALDRAAVAAHCATRLADFKRPKTVAFADALPRTASGTVDREAVRERLREHADF